MCALAFALHRMQSTELAALAEEPAQAAAVLGRPHALDSTPIRRVG
jgi:hypothetical protein